MSVRALVLAFAAAPLFAGCSASGLDAKTSFACKAPEGVTCMSISGVYETSRRNALPGQQPAAPSPASGRDLAMSPPHAAASDSASPSILGAHRTALSSGTPLRSAPRVLRIWLAPYEDSEGDLRDQSHIYITVDRGAWQIEHTRRAIQDRFAPIRSPAPLGPSAAANGTARGDAADAESFPAARVQDAVPSASAPGAAVMPFGGR